MRARLLGILGPTASGKTAVAVAAARELGHAELINADSRQLLRGLAVATFAPSAGDLAGVRCHLLGLADPGEPFSVASWLDAARAAVAEIEGRGAVPIVTGGTGLYVRALVRGFDLGQTPPDPAARAAFRQRAQEPDGLASLAADLRRLDPQVAARVDFANPRRVIRALEIVEARRAKHSAPPGAALAFPALLVGLEVDVAELRRRIERRLHGIFAGGSLLAEVDSALQAGVALRSLARSGIGYAEALALRTGELSPEQAEAAALRRTLRYAKAQRTWLRSEPDIVWLEATERSPRELGTVVAALWRDASA